MMRGRVDEIDCGDHRETWGMYESDGVDGEEWNEYSTFLSEGLRGLPLCKDVAVFDGIIYVYLGDAP